MVMARECKTTQKIQLFQETLSNNLTYELFQENFLEIIIICEII